MRYREHASFARGEALRSAIQELKDESKKRWEAAQCHVRDFCNQHKITIADAPENNIGVAIGECVAGAELDEIGGALAR